MPWRGRTATICKVCGRHVSECGTLSARYKCADCGEGAALSNARDLRAHREPALRRWRRGIAASIGAVLVDELPEQD